MSSSRRQLDQYFTPSFATHELLKVVHLTGNVLECCNGDGAISKEIQAVDSPCTVWTNDIDRSLKVDFQFDATERFNWSLMTGGIDYDWVTSNPPFNQAPQIIPLAYEYSMVGIAMLLRGSYTEPTFDRQHWLKEHEKHLAHIIYLPRISFTGDGKTDNVSCNWYVWTKVEVSGCQLHWVTKEKR